MAEIGVGESHIQGLTADEIAEYLSSLFPDLTTIHSSGDHRNMWKDVQEALPTYFGPEVVSDRWLWGSDDEN